ncbi:MAG: phosphonate ABC transporter, permease protein PhnE [Methylococcales bacterium]|nr:phosphonate ABC transporter, permease protein PhnE [Methylococcales bacterium]
MNLSWYWPTPNGKPPTIAILSIVLPIAVLTLTASTVDISYNKVFYALPRMLDFTQNLWVMPDWQYLPQLGEKMLETVEMTLLATALAVVISMPLGILAAKNASPHPWIFRMTRDLLSFIRALPELVWALVFVSALGLGALPGIMALSLVTVGFMGKFIAESIEVVDSKAIEGLEATGCTKFQSILYAMLPQAVPDFIGSLLYILDHNLRAASILGLVGAGGIGYDMVMAMRLFNYERIGMIALSIYAIVTFLDRLSDVFRQKAIGGILNAH